MSLSSKTRKGVAQKESLPPSCSLRAGNPDGLCLHSTFSPALAPGSAQCPCIPGMQRCCSVREPHIIAAYREGVQQDFCFLKSQGTLEAPGVTQHLSGSMSLGQMSC